MYEEHKKSTWQNVGTFFEGLDKRQSSYVYVGPACSSEQYKVPKCEGVYLEAARQ